MRTLKPIALTLFVSTLALAACQARAAASAPATAAAAAPILGAPTATARIIVVTATQPAYPGPVVTATQPAPTLSTTQAAAATESAFATESAPFQPTTAVPATQAPPTATVAPTPDPNERVGAVIYQDPLDGSSGWNWSFQDEAAAFGLEAGHLKAVASQSGAYWRFTLGPDSLTNGDQQLMVAAHTVACGPSDAFGLLFRAAPQAGAAGQFDLYAFEVNCGGQARFERISGAHATPIVGWTNTTALNIGPGADNTLQVWMAGGDFRFYANGRYLFSAHDDRLAAGTYGFYLQAGAQPGLTVNFDNLIARSIDRS